MEVNSAEAKGIVAATKASIKAGGDVSKMDEFSVTLASLLGKTGSRMSEGSSNGLQSSSSEALEDGNAGGGHGEEMAEARKSAHDDNYDEPPRRDEHANTSGRDDRDDYHRDEPAVNDGAYQTRADDAPRADAHDSPASETADNSSTEMSDGANTSANDDGQNNQPDQSGAGSEQNAAGQNDTATHAPTANAGDGLADAALGGIVSSGEAQGDNGLADDGLATQGEGVQTAAKSGDSALAAVTSQLQAATSAGENTKGNGRSEQSTGRTNAIDGLNKALSALGMDTGTPKDVGGENAHAADPARGAKAGLAAKGDGKNNLQNPNALAGAQNASKALENAAREPDQLQRGGEVASTKTNQAAAIAKAIGGDPKLSVEVKVENTSEKLVSRPRSSLSPTVAADAAKGPQQAQTQGANPNAAQALLQSGQQMATQAQAQLDGSRQAKAGPVQGAAVQAPSAGNMAPAGSAPITPAGGESISNLSQTQNSQQTAAAQKTQRPAPSQRNVMEQVTVQITKAVNAGVDKINIQLRPASLGRVDVQLEMTGDGRISATIIADNRDTLDMLQRGARDLTKALNDAGLQADSQNLNFSLRENNQQQTADGGSNKDEQLDFNDVNEQVVDGPADIDDPAALELALRKLVSEGRVDIRA